MGTSETLKMKLNSNDPQLIPEYTEVLRYESKSGKLIVEPFKQMGEVSNLAYNNNRR